MISDARHKLSSTPTPNFSTKQKVGQLFMIAAFINDSETEVLRIEKLIKENHIGALCFFHSRASAATNFEGKKKVVFNEKSHSRLKSLIGRYQNVASTPLLIAIDAEWGLAMRVEKTPQYPYALTLGALQNRNDLIQQVGFNIGLDCLRTGIHWNLAPVVDINNNPDNPVIGYRSFGDKKEQVTSRANSFLSGMKEAGILNSLKHFPGHGDTDTDSHLALPVLDKSIEELLENECFPFKELMETDLDSIMVGHLAVPRIDSTKQPATTSKKIITHLLREQLGYTGLIISDALNMHAVSKSFRDKGFLELAAFEAGMDMFCFSEHPTEAIDLISTTQTAERIQSSFERVWKLKRKAFEYSGSNQDFEVDHESLNTEIAKNCITEIFKTWNKNWKNCGELVYFQFGQSKSKVFSEYLTSSVGIETHLMDNSEEYDFQETSPNRKIVISIFPPSVKPKTNFGFSEQELEDINWLLENRDCSVYLFGNPFFLYSLFLTKSNTYIVMYQDFKQFQQVACQHFEGKIPPLGKLPFELKPDVYEI